MSKSNFGYKNLGEESQLENMFSALFDATDCNIVMSKLIVRI